MVKGLVKEHMSVYEGPSDVDNGVGIHYGSGGQARQRGAKGKNWDNSINNNNKYIQENQDFWSRWRCT